MAGIQTRIPGVLIVRSRRLDGGGSRSSLPTPLSRAAGKRIREKAVSGQQGLTAEPQYFQRGFPARTIRCARGEALVVAVDLRSDSKTFGEWQAFQLSESDRRSLSVPAGVALGWQIVSRRATLLVGRSPKTERHVQRWLCWDDPDLELPWPYEPRGFVAQRRPAMDFAQLGPRLLPQRSRESRQDELHRSVPAFNKSTTDRKVVVPSSRKDEARRTGPKSRLSQSSAKPSLSKSNSARLSPPLPSQPGIKLAQVQPAAKPESCTILVIGSSGQLGQDLVRHLRPLGTVIGACREPARDGLLPVPTLVDVSRPASIRAAIRRVRPTLIVNATGITNLQQAEQQPRMAQLVNATAPAIMADEAERVGAALVHFCTDKVFDGCGERPWSESDRPNPMTQYGRTKLLGTQAVEASGVPHLIIRTSWLYSTHGDNYIRSLADLATYRSTLTLADDHYGSPTSTAWLAKTLASILQPAASSGADDLVDWISQRGGTYNLSNLGYASRLEVGDQVIATCRQLGSPIVLQHLAGVSLCELPDAGRCGGNSKLDVSKFALEFAMEIPRWQQVLNEQLVHMLGLTPKHVQLSVA